MPVAGTENKGRWRETLTRPLLLGVLAYVAVAATAGTISFITPYLPQPKPLMTVEDFARLLKDDLRRAGVLEYCQPFHCFDLDRGYQGFRVLTP
jgi:hypothetical protein